MTSTAEAQRIDTELAAQWHEIDKAEQRLAWAYSSIQNFYQTVNRTKTTYIRKQRTVLDTEGQILSRAAALAWLTAKAETDPNGYELSHGYSRTYAWELANVREHEAKVTEARDKARDLEAAYTGWSRFFVVTSSTGHIHRSMHCSTCNLTTTYGWLPGLSALTETEAVAQCGPALCSVCYPSAPIDMFGKLSAAQARKLAA